MAGKELAKATAAIAGDGISGTVVLTEHANDDGRAVRVVLELQGDPAKLAPGRHGVHFHAKGECVSPFTSAGGHFDPGPAGNMDPDMNHPFHHGDLPNLVVDERGHGRLDAWTTRITLTDGPLTIFDADGTALMIHKNPDQGVTGAAKSGVSGGPRIACGVITR
jgi:Cu-Zn family superoxide dismutase